MGRRQRITLVEVFVLACAIVVLIGLWVGFWGGFQPPQLPPHPNSARPSQAEPALTSELSLLKELVRNQTAALRQEIRAEMRDSFRRDAEAMQEEWQAHLTEMIDKVRAGTAQILAEPPHTASLENIFQESTDRIVYIRIQKTGSKTLKALLSGSTFFRGHWSRGCKINSGWSQGGGCEEGVQKWFSASPSHGCFLNGHCGYDSMRYLESPSRRARFIVQLREPVLRVLSEYRSAVYGVAHGQRSPMNMWDYEGESSPEKIVYYAEHASTQEGFLSWLEDPRHAMGMQNRQVTMLGKVRDCRADASCLLETAQQALSMDIFHVHTLEHISTGIFLLARAFGVKPPASYSYVAEPNEMMPAPDLDEAAIARTMELNSLDLSLYDYAQRLIKARAMHAFGGMIEDFDCHYMCKDDKESFSEKVEQHALSQKKGAPEMVATQCSIPQSCIDRFFPAST